MIDSKVCYPTGCPNGYYYNYSGNESITYDYTEPYECIDTCGTITNNKFVASLFCVENCIDSMYKLDNNIRKCQ